MADASYMQLTSALQTDGSCAAVADGNRAWQSIVQLPLGVTRHMSDAEAHDT